MMPLMASLALTLAAPEQPQLEARVAIDLNTPQYSDETRLAEDKMKEVIYVDLDGRDVDYSKLDDDTIQQISADLKNVYQAEIATFVNAFVKDEVAVGSPELEARERAAREVEAYFEDLWDTQRDLASEEPRTRDQ